MVKKWLIGSNKRFINIIVRLSNDLDLINSTIPKKNLNEALKYCIVLALNGLSDKLATEGSSLLVVVPKV